MQSLPCFALSLVLVVSVPSEMRYRHSHLLGTVPRGVSCSLSSLQDEVRALSGRWAHSRLLGTLPGVVPVVSGPSERRCAHSPVDGHPLPVDACSLSLLRDEMWALPGGWAHSQVLGTLPRVVPVISAPSEMWCSLFPNGLLGWRGDWSGCCRGIPQSAPEGLFLFGKNPPA